MRHAIAVAVILAATGCTVEPVEGPWRAWLDSPGGELPFGLELERSRDGLRAWILNGEERTEVPQAGFDGESFVLSFTHFDSRVVARLAGSGRRLDGEWTRTGAGGTISRLPFHAEAGLSYRFAKDATASTGSAGGRWRVRFDSEEQPAVGLFRQSADGGLDGTFLTATGDYRFLAGDFVGSKLRLSVFDGAHAFLFLAEMKDDGSLAGDFWSRDTWHEQWTATRDPEARLGDPFAQTRPVEGIPLGDLSYPDLDGRNRRLDDPEFAGKARIIELFGSWCPNCGDAAATLRDLDRRYGDHGLSILGLAFEMTGEFERDARQVRAYQAHHGIDFPVLIAGLSDKALATEAFPFLDRVRAYPTFLFLDRHGQVRAVYSGFSGPATGDAHDELRARFEDLIETLLSEGPA